MSSTYYNLSEDWGWFIDIESSKPVYQIRRDFIKIQNKKFNTHYTKLKTIEEDEYDYYINNQKSLDDISCNNFDVKIKPNNTDYIKNIFNIGSTTLITGILTYVILFVL